MARQSSGIRRGNTKVDTAGGLLKVTLYSTLVLEQKPNGRIRLNNGGWTTSTTRDRMNAGLRQLGVKASVYQRKGTQVLWFRDSAAGEFEFAREIEFSTDGRVVKSDMRGVT